MKKSRREFAKIVSVAALAAPVLAQTTPPAASPPASAPPDQPEKKASPLAAAMTSVLAARYPEHLSPEELRTIEGNLTDTVDYLGKLRAFPLTNADEPDSVFFAEGRE